MNIHFIFIIVVSSIIISLDSKIEDKYQANTW